MLTKLLWRLMFHHQCLWVLSSLVQLLFICFCFNFVSAHYNFLLLSFTVPNFFSCLHYRQNLLHLASSTANNNYYFQLAHRMMLMFDNTAFSFFWLDMIVRLKCCLEIGISNEYVFRRFLRSTL